MDLQDLKIYMLNVFSLVMSFTQIEMGLKLILLIASIGYTISKWIELYRDTKK
jgi:hypothetical protein